MLESAPASSRVRLLTRLETLLEIRIPVRVGGLLLERPPRPSGYGMLEVDDDDADGRGTILEAAYLLRYRRPDLGTSALPIMILENRALCLDLSRSDEKDAPLIDVPLDSRAAPLPVSDSFVEWLSDQEELMTRFTRELQRLKNRKAEVEQRVDKSFRRVERKDGRKSTLHSRPQDWHPRIIRFHDDVVALSAFRYGQRVDALEIDAFFARDHPSYQPGDPMRGLVMTLFAEALKLGGSLDLAFTRDEREDRTGRIPAKRRDYRPRRVECPIPGELVSFAADRGVRFEHPGDGVVTHDEALGLWWQLLELGDEVEGKVRELCDERHMTREALATVMTAGVWSREEVVWILANAPRPDGVLLGNDQPESRLLYAESVDYGLAALLVSRLVRKIIADLTDGSDPESIQVPDCAAAANSDRWSLTCERAFRLPWLLNADTELEVDAGARMIVSARPRFPSRPVEDQAWVRRQVESIASESHLSCLILAMEFRDVDGIDRVVREAAEVHVHVMFAPRRLDHYADEVFRRMRHARHLKRFPARRRPMKISIIQVPSEVWEAPGFWDGIRDAQTFGRWIRKRVDVDRARREFTVNCRTVERIASEEDTCQKLVEVDGQASLMVLQALEMLGDGVAFPFVPPARMMDFRKRVGRELKEILQAHDAGSGLICIRHPFEAGVGADVSRSVTRAPPRRRVPPDFSLLTVEGADAGPAHPSEVVRFEGRLKESLTTGRPLPVSYLRTDLIPQVMRAYVYCRTIERRVQRMKQRPRRDTLWYRLRNALGFPERQLVPEWEVTQHRDPPKPVYLQIAYSDGTEGAPFPLFLLPEPRVAASDLTRVKVGLVSMRHPEVDAVVMRYLLRNQEMQARKEEGSAAQEAFAYERTRRFLEGLMRLIGSEGGTPEPDDIELRVLGSLIDREQSKGCELHVFQTTALEPATVGVYRALIEGIEKYRGRLVVVPRILSKRVSRLMRTGEREARIREADYREAEAWR